MATPTQGTPLHDQLSPEPRDRTRLTLAIGLALIALSAMLMAVDHARRTPGDQPAAGPSAPAPSSIPSFDALTASPSPSPEPRPPHEGQGVFSTAQDAGRYLGRGAELRRFHVSVEKGLGLKLADFTTAVDKILGDPRSWIAGGELKLRRVGADEPADFTIYLASAATSERMCAEGGLDTDGYTSCELGTQVIINADRWVGAVPDFEAPLAEYQAYALNHEVGHELGHGHQACPSPGAPAPVMQQQTLGMQGCLPYGWPYLDGRMHTGPDIP
jgi:hypothetical protein